MHEEELKDNHASLLYGDDGSNSEKIVNCSVISSGRREDESLSNTQNYVPMRQKSQGKIQKNYEPLRNIMKNDQKKKEVDD